MIDVPVGAFVGGMEGDDDSAESGYVSDGFTYAFCYYQEGYLIWGTILGNI